VLHFNANLFEEVAAETDIQYNMKLQSAKLPTLSYLEFRKKVTEGFI
jgi:hypothetical protein